MSGRSSTPARARPERTPPRRRRSDSAAAQITGPWLLFSLFLRAAKFTRSSRRVATNALAQASPPPAATDQMALGFTFFSAGFSAAPALYPLPIRGSSSGDAHARMAQYALSAMTSSWRPAARWRAGPDHSWRLEDGGLFAFPPLNQGLHPNLGLRPSPDRSGKPPAFIHCRGRLRSPRRRRRRLLPA